MCFLLFTLGTDPNPSQEPVCEQKRGTSYFCKAFGREHQEWPPASLPTLR